MRIKTCLYTILYTWYIVLFLPLPWFKFWARPKDQQYPLIQGINPRRFNTRAILRSRASNTARTIKAKMAGIAAKSTSGEGAAGPLPLVSVNHISLVCRSVQDSMDFYENVLGFFPVKRPGSFNFDGAWLFSYGMGIHLLQSPNPDAMPRKTEINPMDNHMSFQCESMQVVESKLEEMKIKFVKRTVEEGGVYVDQLFFHDPDDFMIEICNCENLPVVPLGTAGSACALNRITSASSNNPVLQQQQRSASCGAVATLSHQMLRVP